MSDKWFFVYIMASHPKTGTLYIGITGALGKRYLQHIGELPGGSAFAKKYETDLLVYVEAFQSSENAIVREKRLKSWKRDWKIRLIEEKNPTWRDLSQDLSNWL